MAASSRPPNAAATASGSYSVAACRASAASMTARFRARPSSSTPVPRPAQRAPPPPNRAAAMADAAVVLPMPISPRQTRSQSGATALVSRRHRGEKFLLGQCRRCVKSAVGCSSDSGMTRNLAPCAARQLVDRGASCGKVRHHLRRHLGRIGRYAELGHAVIAGKNQDFDPVEARRRVTLPMREPGNEIFEPAEALRRLGQRRLRAGRQRRWPRDARSAGRDRSRAGRKMR